MQKITIGSCKKTTEYSPFVLSILIPCGALPASITDSYSAAIPQDIQINLHDSLDWILFHRIHIVWAENEPGFPLLHSVKNNNIQISLLCSVNAANFWMICFYSTGYKMPTTKHMSLWCLLFASPILPGSSFHLCFTDYISELELRVRVETYMIRILSKILISEIARCRSWILSDIHIFQWGPSASWVHSVS